MKTRALKKTLSVFLSLLMVFGTVSMIGALPARAAVDNTTLLGRYFSTDNVWYNAARRANGIEWQTGDWLSYDAETGMTRFNGSNYVKFEDDIFSGVSAATGLTFAYTYRPNFDGEHRHLLSIGQNAYGNGTENQFFISGAKSWYSDGKMPVVAWMNGGSETIKAYPAGVDHSNGETYNVVITVDANNGITFYINGEKKTTVYVDSDLNGQRDNVQGFLNQVGSYHYNYFGCSRWTGDAKLDGWVGDFRIYKGVATDAEAQALYAGVSGVSSVSSDMVARYFTSSDVWYNAATGADGAAIYSGEAPSYTSGIGMTYLNKGVVKLENDLLKNVTRESGVSFAFNYRPGFSDNHRHLISAGQRKYGDGQANHFFISGAYAHNSNGNLPMVEWVDGSGGEHIAAYPDGVPQVYGKEYNIVVVIDQTEGVVFYVDGVKKNTVYSGSNKDAQIGYVQSFLDEANTYTYNYVGCSRWTADAKIEGYLSDLRIYKSAKTDADVASLVLDMAGTGFDLNTPSFNATAYHYDDAANGGFANLAYVTRGEGEEHKPAIRGADNSEEFKDIYAVYLKFFNPHAAVMVFDGVHETYAPIQLETKRHNKANVQDQRIYYVVSNSSLFRTKQNWNGYTDSDWRHWAGEASHTQINTDTNLDVYVGSTNDTSRFWWNGVKYYGTGNTDTYYDHESNVSYTIQAFYDYTLGGTSKGTGTITTLSNYYTLNYKPIYDILAEARAAYSDISANAWMYTDESYLPALLAMRRVALCNPNLYNYGRNIDIEAPLAAAAIKNALADYNAIDLVKKTATVRINAGEGTTITVTNNGMPVSDGAEVNYGDTLAVSAAAQDAYDQHTPVVTISDETSASSTLVNRPEITISTTAIDLNTYTLTFDPNGGTLSGNAAVTATYTQPLPAATPAVRDGYTFLRYAYNSGSADYTYYNQNYTNSHGNYDVKGNVTVVAQWSPTDYAITFVPGEGSIDPSALSNFGDAYNIEDTKALPTVTAPEGYHFDGWAVSSSNAGDPNGWGEEKIGQNAAVTGKWGNVTLTASFAPNTDTAYTVEYYEMDTAGAYPAAASRTVSCTGTTGETASADTAAPAGFTFDSDNVNNVLSAPIAANGSTVLKVYLARNQYTVTVTLGEGAALNVANGARYYYGETVTLTVSALTGYDIATLNITVNGETVANNAQIIIADDVTVAVAALARQQIQVTVNAGTGTTISGAATQSYEYGTSLTVDAAAVEGYNPAGLRLMANGAVVERPYTFTVTEPVTISTTDLNKIRCTVTETQGEGTVITGGGTYDWGDPVTVSAAAKPGYEGALVLKVNDETVGNPYTFTIHSDVSVSTDPLTALVYHTVVFNNYDNTKLYETTVVEGGTAEYVGDTPSKPAAGDHTYSFIGWDKPLENITETTVFTAKFKTVHSYTVRGYDSENHFMKCSECDMIDASSVQAHSLAAVIDREATCKVEGLSHKACTCGYATEPVSTGLNENNHKNVVDAPAVAATCCTAGYTAGTVCADCGEYLSGHDPIEADPVNGHLYPDVWTPANGTHTKTCTREGCTEAVLNHTISENCTGGVATCSALKKCTVCGGAYGETDPANHENLQPVQAQSASCTAPGNNAYYFCDACGNSYTNAAGTEPAAEEDIVIPATGHAWSVTFAWVSATADGAAAEAYCVCANAPAHNKTVEADVDTVGTTGAQCGQPGSVTYRASVTLDGTVFTSEDKVVNTDALAHIWNVSWSWNADHTEAVASFTCERDPQHAGTATDNAPAEVTVTPASCEGNKTVEYTASVLFDGNTYSTETEPVEIPDSALGHTYALNGWSWAEDCSSAVAGFVCTVENCGATAAETDSSPDVVEVRAVDCENDRVVKYTASVSFTLTKNGEAQTFTDTTGEITLENTRTPHAWGTPSYAWTGYESVTATHVCGNYTAHVETETVQPGYAVTAQPTYAETGEGTYTAVFANAAFETQTATVEIASLKAQAEAALAEAGSDITDIDALIETAQKIVNGEAPYTAPYEESYISALSGALDAFNSEKNDPAQVAALAQTIGTIDTLVDEADDHIVYTVTYVLNGGTASNKTSFVRTEEPFALTNPTKAGCTFTGWTGTGLEGAVMSVTVNPADAENKTFTANWAVDNSEAEAAISNAAAVIADVNDDYEDRYSQQVSALADALGEELGKEPPDTDRIRELVDSLNALVDAKDQYKHKFTVNLGYKDGYAPTCTLSGVTVLKCENCEKTEETAAAALGHELGEWQVITPADYGVNGEARRYCSRCDYFESKELVMTESYDRQIKFNVISKMHYVIEVGDGFAVYNTNTILWYSAAELHFHVYKYSNAGYENYTVFINGVPAEPDANGSYTIPAGSSYDTVSIMANSAPNCETQPGEGGGSSGSGVCAYCGETHPSTLWDRLIALIHAILAFFRNLFKR